jgi:hypothetical protein
MIVPQRLISSANDEIERRKVCCATVHRPGEWDDVVRIVSKV